MNSKLKMNPAYATWMLTTGQRTADLVYEKTNEIEDLAERLSVMQEIQAIGMCFSGQHSSPIPELQTVKALRILADAMEQSIGEHRPIPLHWLDADGNPTNDNDDDNSGDDLEASPWE